IFIWLKPINARTIDFFKKKGFGKLYENDMAYLLINPKKDITALPVKAKINFYLIWLIFGAVLMLVLLDNLKLIPGSRKNNP
ncbi:MAG: hypothetical protein JW867_01130, partial [Candidatus Omnitrophica bacterium]|nr:hypothetical protein [Candidatus Omnitrophota bacterium]